MEFLRELWGEATGSAARRREEYRQQEEHEKQGLAEYLGHIDFLNQALPELIKGLNLSSSKQAMMVQGLTFLQHAKLRQRRFPWFFHTVTENYREAMLTLGQNLFHLSYRYPANDPNRHQLENTLTALIHSSDIYRAETLNMPKEIFDGYRQRERVD